MKGCYGEFREKAKWIRLCIGCEDVITCKAKTISNKTTIQRRDLK